MQWGVQKGERSHSAATGPRGRVSRRFAPRRTGGSLIAAGALILPLTACGYTQSVSPVYPTYVEQLPFTAERPVARELRYTYQQRTDLGGKEGTPIGTADPVTKQLLRQGEEIPLVSATPAPNQDWGDHYTELANQAQDRGDTDSALMYRELAVSQAETQIAMNRIAGAGTMFNTYMSVMSSLGAVGLALFESGADRVAAWTEFNTRAIGDEAPEGSILHLDFVHIVHGRRFRGTSRMEFFVTALLDDGRGNTYRSDRSVELYTYKPDSPPDFLPADALPLEIPIGTPQPEESLSGIGDDPFLRMMAILARSAVANLYTQVNVRERGGRMTGGPANQGRP